ncbi:MAG: glycosyltransferase [Candidatus Omnitrophica bacterium]|nr:glycosyltransferase [Candidatus Omnitrophota bacterium]MDD5435964.1 glycosyltransferase [Candidatus Omnitrophota bacterium]
MKKKKVLILYATAGIGHKKAAMAVKAAFDELKIADVEVTLADALDYTNAFFKWSYLEAYLLMVNKLPTLWGFFYYFTDNFYANLIVSKLRRLNNWLNSGKLAKYLKAEKPDVVISTHFFATEVISELKRSGKVDSKLITVVTDYRLHSWWVAGHTDMYVVAGQDAHDDLVRWGTDPSRVKMLGIPVEPIFTKKFEKAGIIRAAGLKEGVFTVLVIGGGFGVGPIEDIIKTIGDISQPIQIVTVCGHNEELVKKLEALKPSLKADIKVFGFVNNVYDYMSIADVLISKSGGITVSESLTKELPMVIIAPIMGQETRNSDYLMKYGAAVKIAKASDLKEVVEYLVAHPERMAAMREAIRAIRKPLSCYDIAKLSIDICG